MKVVFLVTGSGDSFYCSNCFRDMMYFKAVKTAPGVTANAIPLYLPPDKMYIESGFDSKVFFGAISLYLREKVKLLAKMPSFLDKILDSPPLLKIASRQASTTRTDGLEDLTLNMINSNHVSREREVRRLVQYLVKSGKPDVIQLSNALIIGLARQLKQHMDVKIVCSLQNEDDWINEMAEPFQTQAWQMIGKEAINVDAFVTPSGYYKDFIIEKTGIAGEKIHTIPSGLDLNWIEDSVKTNPDPAIGYFSRVSYNNGFDKLTDAFILLKKMEEFGNLTLHVCGGFTSDDKPFISEQIKKIKKNGFSTAVKIYSEFMGSNKQDFMNSIDILSVPVRKYDAYGLYILEANASGVPAVQPNTGAFPEILTMTGGGVLYSPDTVEELVRNLKDLLKDKSRLKELGLTGKDTVKKILSFDTMASGLKNVYETI
jgi:glycosyltransferase involved in cell wall biosynthesis